MVKSEAATKTPSADEIIGAVLKKIGGKPENFHKATCTQVHADTYRVNIWTATPGGEIGFLKKAEIFHSEFYFLPN